MSDEHDDDTETTITLELPARVAAKLAELQRRFGDELVADLLQKTSAAVEGKLALRGARFDQDEK
ncbi:MAG: hypothetical protein ACLQBA_25310 [Candidatus Binataceae bacterium]